MIDFPMDSDLPLCRLEYLRAYQEPARVIVFATGIIALC